MVPAQTGLPEAETVTETGSKGLTVIAMVDENAGLPVGQTALEVSRHSIISPFAGMDEYNGAFVPTTVPFCFHSYCGPEPPLTGSAVKFTVVPLHTGLAEETTETLTASKGLTTMVMGVEDAGFPAGQIIFDVSSQRTTSPFIGT